ncbi:MAG: non-canonical purine NTP pyrophosphatase [Treponema sp.]|jgi:XTP/dITP diphosphohydrolase|nr:non-canonical purine NTP pyrophosphatase [Treponema sp.]
MTLWLATNNAHKRAELAAIFAGFSLKTPQDAGIAGFCPAETGSTFLENALLKARALLAALRERGIREPVIADDSGLCVAALGGRPGIFSARYAGPGKTAAPGETLASAERNRRLLAEVGDAPDRSAFFVCAMVLLRDEYRMAAAQETLRGRLVSRVEEAAGEGGFGYDPILYLPEQGCTVAQLAEAEKNRLSHRGKAGRALARFLAGA